MVPRGTEFASSTVLDMTPTAPPIQAQAGQRRARGSLIPAMPIRTGAPAPAPRAMESSPLKELRFPTILTPPIGLVIRCLDRGRLYTPDLVALLGWTPGLALEADVGRSNRLRLRARLHHEGSTIGSKRVHLDGNARIAVTTGLRDHLGIAEDGQVIAWAERDAMGQPTGVVAVASPAIFERALAALVTIEDAARADVDNDAGLRRHSTVG